MKLIYLKILKSIIIVLFIWSVLSGIASYPMMFVDYPCFQSYDEENNCVPQSQYRTENISDSTIFESFLSTDYANQFGGGCAYYKQDENKFTLNSAAGDLKINVIDNQINVNGDSINKKESYSKKKYFGLNFWTTSFVGFTYYGKVSYCRTNSTLKRHVIIGSYGTKHSLLKGLSILSIFIISFIYLTIQTRKIKKVKKKSRFFHITKPKLILTSILLAFTILSIILNFLQYTFLVDLLISGFGLLSIINFRDGKILLGLLFFLIQILYLYLISCIIFFIITYFKKE